MHWKLVRQRGAGALVRGCGPPAGTFSARQWQRTPRRSRDSSVQQGALVQCPSLRCVRTR